SGVDEGIVRLPRQKPFQQRYSVVETLPLFQYLGAPEFGVCAQLGIELRGQGEIVQRVFLSALLILRGGQIVDKSSLQTAFMGLDQAFTQKRFGLGEAAGFLENQA